MQLFSLGNLYIGTDDTSFCDIFIHIGRLRIEYASPRHKFDGSIQESVNGSKDGSVNEGNEPPPSI